MPSGGHSAARYASPVRKVQATWSDATFSRWMCLERREALASRVASVGRPVAVSLAVEQAAEQKNRAGEQSDSAHMGASKPRQPNMCYLREHDEASGADLGGCPCDGQWLGCGCGACLADGHLARRRGRPSQSRVRGHPRSARWFPGTRDCGGPHVQSSKPMVCASN